MLERDAASNPAIAPTLAPTADFTDPIALKATPAATRNEWRDRQELAWHCAETERVKVLVDFLARPIHAHGGADPDPDIVTAYNLAVESALQGIRRATAGR